MKDIHTWITDFHYSELSKLAEKRGVTKYKIVQGFVEKGLEDRYAQTLSVNLAFWFLCYSLIASTVLLIAL